MIFTMDIGNTNIKTGLFQGKELVRYWRLSTNRSSTSDEYGMLVTNLFRSAGLSPDQVTGIMLSSVVPPVNFTIEHMCNDYFGIVPKFVVPGVKTGINIQYDNPRALGSDRICNAVAVQAFYGAPCIFIDFGTATTFGVVDEKGRVCGRLHLPRHQAGQRGAGARHLQAAQFRAGQARQRDRQEYDHQPAGGHDLRLRRPGGIPGKKNEA